MTETDATIPEVPPVASEEEGRLRARVKDLEAMLNLEQCYTAYVGEEVAQLRAEVSHTAQCLQDEETVHGVTRVQSLRRARLLRAALPYLVARDPDLAQCVREEVEK